MQMVNVSKRLLEVPASPIRKLAAFALEAEKKGVKVYHLNIGDPDIETPAVMMDVLKNWQRNPIGYAQSQGNPNLIAALKRYYHKLGYKFIKEKNIQITIGGSEAISMAFFATCGVGDEVLVFEPFYANYNSYAAINGIKLIPVLTDIKDGFHLPNREVIETHISPKTKAILICSPNNPTGTVYTQKEIEMLVAIANKHNLFLLSDEVYREFVYDGGRQISLIGYMTDFTDNVIVLDSLSKRYSLCGARIGCLVSLNEEIMSGVLRMAQGRLSAGLVDQAMAAKLAEVPDKYIREIQNEYQARRDVVYQGLKKIPGVMVPRPEGAFYIIAALPVDDAEKFCKWLLTDFRYQNETIMLAPAAGFYATKSLGLNEVRIAYVLKKKDLKRAVEILKKALKVYSSLV